jgi:hypothetical protein
VKVIIPAACFNAYQIDAASFVFKTIRTGFPTAEIVLVIGNTVPVLRDAIIDAAIGAGINPARNDDYADRPLVDVYAGFLQTEEKPFFYCDTDIVFWDSIESHLPEFEEASLAGRYIPKFFERFTRCVTMPRLHSCLLYVNPLRVRRETEEYYRSLGPETPYTPRPDLFRPIFVSCKEAEDGRVVTKNYFYDVLSMVYHALPGTVAFSEPVNACFDHLTCGSVAHLVGPEYGVDLVAMHRAAMRDPKILKGLWLKQRAAYERGFA